MVIHVIFLGIWAVLVGYQCGWHFPKLNKNFNVLYAIICTFYILRLVFFQNAEEVVQIIRLGIFYLDLYVTNALLVKDESYIIKFSWFHVIMLLFTIVGIALLAMGMLRPLGIIEISSAGEERLLNFGLFFVKLHDGATELLDAFARPAGYYDEPGSLGLMILLLLIYNKTHSNDKRIELLLLIGGFVSMSMAYIVAALLYIGLFLVNKRYLAFLGVLIPVCYLLFSSYHEGENEFADYIYARTLGRAEKIHAGEDQSRDYEASYRAFADNWLLGETSEELDRKYPESTHETIWYYLAQNGVWGG